MRKYLKYVFVVTLVGLVGLLYAGATLAQDAEFVGRARARILSDFPAAHKMGGGMMMGQGHGRGFDVGAGLHRGEMLDALAESLGMTADELQESFRAGQTIEDIANEKGVSLTDLAETMYQVGLACVDEAVAEGLIDETQAESIRTKMAEYRDACINDGECFFPPRGPAGQESYERGSGFGHGHHGGGEEMHAPRGRGNQNIAPDGEGMYAPRGRGNQNIAPDGEGMYAPRGRGMYAPRGRGMYAPRGIEMLEPVAETLGMTLDELHEAFQAGQTIETIADEKGVSLTDVAEAMYQNVLTHLDEAVAAGQIDDTHAETVR
ncbi:MAG: hypothetical protein B6242_10735 [Anaerolineaceae bacterium 4572_78]|nr:MAG: hypothetical protein B6242_10735 [Anaerolineaceae bacterium 4572_78]